MFRSLSLFETSCSSECPLTDEETYEQKVPAVGSYDAIVVGCVEARNEAERSFIMSGKVYGVSSPHHQLLPHHDVPHMASFRSKTERKGAITPFESKSSIPASADPRTSPFRQTEPCVPSWERWLQERQVASSSLKPPPSNCREDVPSIRVHRGVTTS